MRYLIFLFMVGCGAVEHESHWTDDDTDDRRCSQAVREFTAPHFELIRDAVGMYVAQVVSEIEYGATAGSHILYKIEEPGEITYAIRVPGSNYVCEHLTIYGDTTYDPPFQLSQEGLVQELSITTIHRRIYE